MPDTPNEASPLTAHEDHPSWHAFLNKRMLICVFFGFTSGLPLFTLCNLLQAWFTTAHVNVKEIGLFALIGLPYTWKFVWSPLMDRYVPRLPGWRPGRRRGRMLVTQILVTLAIASFGFFSPAENILAVAAVAALVAFFGARQDIVTDAYRRELLADMEQGLGNAIHVNAYKGGGPRSRLAAEEPARSDDHRAVPRIHYAQRLAERAARARRAVRLRNLRDRTHARPSPRTSRARPTRATLRRNSRCSRASRPFLHPSRRRRAGSSSRWP